MADDLAKVVPQGCATLAVPTDITKAEDVAALAEQCVPPPHARVACMRFRPGVVRLCAVWAPPCALYPNAGSHGGGKHG